MCYGHDSYQNSSHSPRLTPVQYSLTVQNRGLKHQVLFRLKYANMLTTIAQQSLLRQIRNTWDFDEGCLNSARADSISRNGVLERRKPSALIQGHRERVATMLGNVTMYLHYRWRVCGLFDSVSAFAAYIFKGFILFHSWLSYYGLIYESAAGYMVIVNIP